jgi:hypothetical protein
MDYAITSRKNADDQKGNLNASIFTVFQRVHVKVLTVTRAEDGMCPTKWSSASVS